MYLYTISVITGRLQVLLYQGLEQRAAWRTGFCFVSVQCTHFK